MSTASSRSLAWTTARRRSSWPSASTSSANQCPGAHRPARCASGGMLPVSCSAKPPGGLVGTLGVVERVETNAERAELKSGNALVDLRRNVVDGGRQIAAITQEVVCAERLVGKAEIHYCCRASLGGDLPNQATLSQQVEHAPI